VEVKKSEDCLIFYGLTPKLTNMRQVYNSLSDFMSKKQIIDPSDRFNLIAYLRDSPNYLDHFTFDPNLILKTLKSFSRNITQADIAGGIFVAITFIIEVFKRISEKIFRLLILIDYETPEIPPQFMQVLVDLCETVKDMPFFIDVVSIDKKNVQKNWNLTKLVELTEGKFFRIERIRDFSSIVTTITEKKYITEKKSKILKKNQPFYINLADDLVVFDKTGVCSICFQRDDYDIVQCPSCETLAHKTCWSQWAKTSNIGIPHVFRCHNCFNILKLDKKDLLGAKVRKIPVKIKVNEVKKMDIDEYLKGLENSSTPKVIQIIDPIVSDGESIFRVITCPNCYEMTTNIKTHCPRCNLLLKE
jgi:hypothetical protein